MAKRTRIVFVKKEKGRSLMGVTQLQFVRAGAPIAVENGGGFVGDMFYRDGMIEVRKVDEKGNPVRNFGSVMHGEKRITLEADYAIFPAHLCEALLAVEEDDGQPEALTKITQSGVTSEPFTVERLAQMLADQLKASIPVDLLKDPPPAKPVEKQQGQQQRR